MYKGTGQPESKGSNHLSLWDFSGLYTNLKGLPLKIAKTYFQRLKTKTCGAYFARHQTISRAMPMHLQYRYAPYTACTS
jgi:hypothetical protein